jgi:hypothetical protein
MIIEQAVKASRQRRRMFLTNTALASLMMLQSGLSDYTAQNLLNFVGGLEAFPALASRYLALFTTAPTSDAGTGGTEVSGTGYARVQVAGALSLSASFTTSSTTLTLASTAPAWLLALGTNGSGCNVYDATNSQQIGTVSSISGTTVTLTSTAAHASSGSADSIIFSAFGPASASSGSEPSTSPASITNAAAITFPQATANWGTVTSFALYDASTSGNMQGWDYIGNFKWIPFSCTSASPGVLTVDSTGDAPANSTPCVVTAKYGGTLPTTGGSWSGVLTSAGLSGATFNLGVNTTSIGGGQFRQITQQSIPANVTASFAASTLVLTAA